MEVTVYIFCPLWDKLDCALAAVNPLLLLSVTKNVELQELEPPALGTYVAIQVTFRPCRTLRQELVHPKDPVPANRRKGVVYSIPG